MIDYAKHHILLHAMDLVRGAFTLGTTMRVYRGIQPISIVSVAIDDQLNEDFG